MNHWTTHCLTLVSGYLARAWRTCPSHQEARKPRDRGNSNIWIIFTPKIGEDEPILTIAYFSEGLVKNHQPETIWWFLEWIILLPWQVSLQRRTLREDLHSCPGRDPWGVCGSSKPISVWLMLFDSGSGISINDKFDKCHNLPTIPLWRCCIYLYILYICIIYKPCK